MSSQQPKYKRIMEHLIRGISSKAYEDILPSENELALEFSVSRMTARKALSELVRDGYAQRIPGKGTFILERRVTQGFFRVRPFRDYAKENHMKPGTKLLEIKETVPPGPIGEKLKTDHAILVRRVHYFDTTPVRFETRYLAYDLCSELLHENLETESINELLIHKQKLPITNVWQRLEAVVLDHETAPFLDLSPGSPAFRLQRQTYTFDQPVTYVEYFLRGDSFAFEDTFQPQQEEVKNG